MTLHLFQAFGIELEYMIVDRDTLEVRPIADQLLKEAGGGFSDFENGMVTWSNELVLHVIEIKCTRPESDLKKLAAAFHENVRQINKLLLKWNAMLLPTAAHPTMDPLSETKLWPHDNNEIYAVYNKIFDCRGHGWSNLQSTHLNLPFRGDEEFARLHSAIRIILPLLPSLCASSTVLDGKITRELDARMTFYKTNQKAIPSITGQVVPEEVYSESDYNERIYKKISADIAPFNGDDILDPVWVNSRGAMARFDRGSIEIRIMDIQECPAADMAIQEFVIDLLKKIEGPRIKTEILAEMLDDTIVHGASAKIQNKEWLAVFGLKEECTAGDVLRKLGAPLPEGGNLSTRIRTALTTQSIPNVYRKLADCLEKNTLFIP